MRTWRQLTDIVARHRAAALITVHDVKGSAPREKGAHMVVRPDGAPPDGAAAIDDAIVRIESATGLRFVHDGDTTEKPSTDRPTMDPRRYGARWSPVLVTSRSNSECLASAVSIWS